MEDVPACGGGLELDNLYDPFQSKLFCDSTQEMEETNNFKMDKLKLE